ncbi:MAG: outer membrane beta-barrel protein [Gammaproteobacteria bacterium]|nr:outer membrane beta-barrel protein [Gammaproteobacteria bacterium]MDP7271725.1 outer membrane beta-barrel protein [Gammaproteobacteria bacterium]MDP7419853.1 outer membrane beta-barrel protein [Gammaproteobacteria bacterium]HJP03600.1 outer membrane beta-barrel protein [Gammaproteobacteria bacterium]
MLRHILFAVLILALGGVANAAAPKEQGSYVGVGFGNSELDDDGLFDGSDLDDDDVSWQLMGGIRFNNHVAVEARFTNLGKATVDGDDIEAETTTIHVVGIMPLGADSWELFGQLGIGLANVDFEEDEEDETVNSYGAGVRYHFSEENALALQWDTYEWDGSDSADLEVDTVQLLWTHTF